jgi:hypothetical protein
MQPYVARATKAAEIFWPVIASVAVDVMQLAISLRAAANARLLSHVRGNCHLNEPRRRGFDRRVRHVIGTGFSLAQDASSDAR